PPAGSDLVRGDWLCEWFHKVGPKKIRPHAGSFRRPAVRTPPCDHPYGWETVPRQETDSTASGHVCAYCKEPESTVNELAISTGSPDARTVSARRELGNGFGPGGRAPARREEADPFTRP